ncbi:Bm8 interacting protein 2d-2 [Operophtera brumata]|uniref:Bm8 interacting protein 2d-2 n=1 Tax=Operophtera brumata TaxID=104452 RepID=A0A0L7KWI1_OPEBR|nr:Bm8 interacting protein 2d-2 [Operophtera brumata]
MEQFIEVVKQFPVLWNTQLKDYHNLIKKDVAWKQIVEEISNPDIPDDSLKRMKASTSGQAASPANNWKYAELLEFLLPHMKNRKRTGNVSINDKNTLASTSTQSQNTLPGTSIESQNTLPSTSTESQSTEIFEEIPNDENTSERPRIKKRKVDDDASLNDLLQKVDNDFMKRYILCASQLKSFPIGYKEM